MIPQSNDGGNSQRSMEMEEELVKRVTKRRQRLEKYDHKCTSSLEKDTLLACETGTLRPNSCKEFKTHYETK